MKKIQIVQVKSAIGSSKRQRANLAALKLGKISPKAVCYDANPSIMGMVEKIKHLVKVTYIK